MKLDFWTNDWGIISQQEGESAWWNTQWAGSAKSGHTHTDTHDKLMTKQIKQTLSNLTRADYFEFLQNSPICSYMLLFFNNMFEIMTAKGTPQ